MEHRTQMQSSSQVVRVYRLNWRWRIFPVFRLLLGMISAYGLMTGRLHSRFHSSRPFGMFQSITLLVAGTVLTAHAFTVKIILSDDAIQKRGLLENGRLLISEIGRRSETIVAGRLGISDSWRLEPKDPGVRTMSVSNSFNLDNVFYTWLGRIPAISDPDSPVKDDPDPSGNDQT